MKKVDENFGFGKHLMASKCYFGGCCLKTSINSMRPAAYVNTVPKLLGIYCSSVMALYSSKFRVKPAEEFLFVLALADRLHAARNEVTQGMLTTPDLSILLETIEGPYSVSAAVATYHDDSLIHSETMRIDSTNVDIAQVNVVWMATTISLRWPDNACKICGSDMDIINAIIRAGVACQSILKIISNIHVFYDKPTTTWAEVSIDETLMAHKLAAWAC
ncbi:hypothetical protein Ancab_019656 [Ancistrocladus abbreviatus]